MILVLPVVLCGALDDIMSGLYRRQDDLAHRLRDATYDAAYQYEERNPDGSLRAVETCTRRVYTKDGRQAVEFLRVTADGRVLEGRERDRKIRELRGKGLAQDQTRMPFQRETRQEYRYRTVDEDSLDGRAAWVVEFEPCRRDGHHIVGRGWVLADSSYDVARMEFRPDRLPFVVPWMRMTLHYAPVEHMMLPDRFDLEMRVHVRFLVTLADRYITVEDRFSGFRFNTGLPDSLFNQR